MGPEVRKLKKGERVGWGYLTGSCGLCEQCLSGNDEYCPERELYGMSNLDQGSFAEQAVWKESFLFKIPDNMTDAEAAPLMCGGATVWSALNKYGLSSTATIGVLGVGGLGHLAIQFAAKMGMNVVVLSTSDSKKAEALKLGATRFVVVQDKKEIDIGPSKLNALLVTASVDTDWSLYLPLLSPRATVIPLTMHFGNFVFPHFDLLASGIRVQGTVIASRYEVTKMLSFASRTGVRPVLMSFPLNKDGIEKSIQTLTDGKMRYRGVLVSS